MPYDALNDVRGLTARSRRSDWIWAAWVALGYFVAAAIAMVYHEMWRDELHCWLVARDSETPWAVVRARAYDGQPPLWYLILWVLTRVTWHPEAMRVLHIGIATANVLLFARFAPFGRPARALFPFGYFVVYEYAALSRCYGLALLFAILICHNHPLRLRRPITTGLLLAGLALTTTVATLVATAYTLAFVIDWTEVHARRFHGSAFSSCREWETVGLSASGGVAAALCAWPPADSTVAQIGKPPIMPWEFASTRVVAALVPIPRPTFFYWNSNVILDHIPYPALSFALAAAAFAWILFVVSFDCFASVLFGTSVVLLVGLFSGVYSGSVRHHGFIYVAFVMSAWIALQAAHDRRGIDGSTRAFRERALGVTFVAVLILQCPGSVVAIAFDVRYIFSSGARAARSLQENGLADALIVAEVDYPATAMLGQLGPRAMAYSPRTGRPFSFVRWTRSRSWDPTDEDTLQFAAALGRSRGEDPVVVMNRPLLPELIDSAGVRRVAELYDSMIEEENFYIYRVSRTRAPRSPSVAH